MTTSNVHVSQARGPGEVAECAAIWARATARRDNESFPATVETALPGLQRRLAIDGSKLIVLRLRGMPTGFTLFAPREETLEVFYLAVDPEAWGSGLGTRLLSEAEHFARELNLTILELWVIDDNDRAIGVYEHAGWNRTDELQRDRTSGRWERRFIRRLS
ncbi:GNAT superfamily N-acetyltransferase [Arthrobacter pigmenti]|uniref:GNAT superfamily N-acetyltransferase n=1 Tax=Arthrobacter pigmenti TaxID=271432 RepID=A0A846RP34_9MICC|nr:GNAT superfamily N-acetyltransferase [Arthrobacter pigmenti]